MPRRDPEYIKRVGNAIYAVIIHESTADNGDVVVDTAVVFDILMSIGGTLIAGDPTLKSARGLREFSENNAKQLRRLLQEARDDPKRRDIFPSEVSGREQ